jgi:uncharacterized protein YndB with AHSA1/START domain
MRRHMAPPSSPASSTFRPSPGGPGATPLWSALVGLDRLQLPRADVDFRVGGSTLVTMQVPLEWGEIEFHNRWTYTLVNASSRIEFVSEFDDADARVICPAAAGIPLDVPAQVPHVVALEPLVRRNIALTDRPSARANRRISAQSSTLSAPHDRGGGPRFGCRHRAIVQLPSTRTAPLVRTPDAEAEATRGEQDNLTYPFRNSAMSTGLPKRRVGA